MNIYSTSVELPYISKEAELTVYFDYSPEEPAVIHPVDNAYPGAPETCEIIQILLHIETAETPSELRTVDMSEFFADEDLEALCSDILSDKETWS